MKISTETINKITVRAKNRLALEMDCSVATVQRWIKDNDENGELTKASVVKILREETGLSDAEILVEDAVKEEQS